MNDKKQERLADFVRQQRKIHKLTQQELADRAGVGIRFIRELEDGKPTLRMDKVNVVLDLFGCALGPVVCKSEEQPMTRKAEVYLYNRFAGILSEDENGYDFQYAEEYLQSEKPVAVSFLLPLRKEKHHDRTLFPFFDGLIPEGWLLDIAEKNWKLDANDRMGLLLACCRDCIGAASIREATK